MKTRFFLTFVLFFVISTCSAQQNSAWEKLSWLIGEWKGEGVGQPGKGGGTFSFTPDLGNNIIVRKSHSEYPAADNKPAIIHDDLMVIYMDHPGSTAKAIYFDNEGHTINYNLTYSDKSIIFTSDRIPNTPVFRLVYELIENSKVNTRFEMSQDGEKFTSYVEGISKKTK